MKPAVNLAEAFIERAYRIELAARVRFDLEGAFDCAVANGEIEALKAEGNVITLVVERKVRR